MICLLCIILWANVSPDQPCSSPAKPSQGQSRPAKAIASWYDCSKTSRNVLKRQKTSRNIPKHTKTSAMPTQAQLSMMQYCIILRTSWNLFINSDAINWFMFQTSQNIPKHLQMSQNIPQLPETSPNFPKGPQTLQNIQKRPTMSSQAWCNSLFSWFMS